MSSVGSNGSYYNNNKNQLYEEQKVGVNESSKRSNSNEIGGPNSYAGYTFANTYQAATLNKLLPLGFRIEQEDNALRYAEMRKSQVLSQ